ncbi:hypothetical protein QDR33_17560 [Acinetobacter baumannii]|uniref:hypothetical protein n=1 Tax=Acinetobacter baumannii TaxID=470 RepID=UPI00234257FD|nr:hypothetical protein [Acinetobacter baumannii]MDC4765065.1 hypothetical protein [Acinetobacter baumannii]MDC4861758.1 hypothetical protein [Acinetobacter baumannii]MDC5296144.1 hypothetical protein [Acinetobacter baumannii]MDH2493352.1 hypothetical protein [Acinetobacter baumannii]
MAKKPLAVSFDDDVATSEEAFVSGAGTGTVAAPSIEAKPEEPTVVNDPLTRVTRNGTVIKLEKNDLPTRKRQRKAHGTNLTIPLYFEELIAIEEAFEKENLAESLNDFIRVQLLAKAKSILGADEFKEVLANELNKVK